MSQSKIVLADFEPMEKSSYELEKISGESTSYFQDVQ